jgi:hypothetical protein
MRGIANVTGGVANQQQNAQASRPQEKLMTNKNKMLHSNDNRSTRVNGVLNSSMGFVQRNNE